MNPEDATLREAFARWLRAAMQKHGITASEIEKRLGRERDWLSRFERGLAGSELRWEEARDLIAYLGESPDELRLRLVRGERLDGRS